MIKFVALAIFLAMFVFIIMEKFERHVITLACGLLTLILVFGIGMHSGSAIMNTLNFKEIITLDFWYHTGEAAESSSGINWATIFFIAGMMVMVEGMGHAGFFRWLCMRIAKLVQYRISRIFIAFMLMSGILSMFIDSITVILFLAAVTVELAKLLKFNPVAMILAEIFCANLGGSATMCGDPPNIIIGTALGYSFSDFITNTGLIAGIALVMSILYFYLVFRKKLVSSETIDTNLLPEPKEAIRNKKSFIISCLIFLCAVVMLVTHAMTGLTVAFIGIFVMLVTLITSGKDAVTLLKKVDYKTILFFVGLFIVVGGLEQTGVLEILSEFIGKVCNGNVMLMIVIIIWGSAIASAFIDNIPFAATMIPVIRSLALSQGVDLSTLAWALSMGTDIGGSATPIGASANVVGTAVAGKAGHPIGWGKYCLIMAPATIMVLLFSTIFIFVRYL